MSTWHGNLLMTNSITLPLTAGCGYRFQQMKWIINRAGYAFNVRTYSIEKNPQRRFNHDTSLSRMRPAAVGRTRLLLLRTAEDRRTTNETARPCHPMARATVLHSSRLLTPSPPKRLEDRAATSCFSDAALCSRRNGATRRRTEEKRYVGTYHSNGYPDRPRKST